MSSMLGPARNADGTIKALPLAPGQKFGRLTVGEKAWKQGHNWLWRCNCECGKSVLAVASNLRSGNTQSCGCHRIAVSQQKATKHGMSGTKSFSQWSNMLRRCRDPKNPAYANYGGRGIQVCGRWGDFSAFFADMGERPLGRTLERVNNDGNYSPDNCVWATAKAQGRNRRVNVTATINGRSMTLAEWAEESGAPYGRLLARRRLGWPDADLLLPKRPTRSA